MRRSVFAAGALAFCASTAQAFAPSTSGLTSLLATPALSHKARARTGPASSLRMATGTLQRIDVRVQKDADSLAKDSSKYVEYVNKLFPGAVDEAKYIEAMSKVVMEEGFNPKTAINLVSTCRDEICRPFTEKLDSLWGQSFSIASLGGFVFCGKTGFGAGMAHSPICPDGKERYVFWIGPHIAVGPEDSYGEVGKIWRPGREAISSACGALIALNGQIESGKLDVGLDPSDTEMSLVRQQVLGKLTYGQVPNLVGITYAAHDCILDQVKATAKIAADPKNEYVIISGVQIHGALGKNFWWPGSVTMIKDNQETDLSAKFEAALGSYDLASWLKAEVSSRSRTPLCLHSLPSAWPCTCFIRDD